MAIKQNGGYNASISVQTFADIGSPGDSEFLDASEDSWRGVELLIHKLWLGYSVKLGYYYYASKPVQWLPSKVEVLLKF